jgi:hypothetical protein
MSENKPIIFINSPQTDFKRRDEQCVFDSRIKKNKQEVNVRNEHENLLEREKLLKKISLLDKRAKGDHYVIVEVITENNIIEGSFKERNENEIIILNQREEFRVLIDDIIEIKILKV